MGSSLKAESRVKSFELSLEKVLSHWSIYIRRGGGSYKIQELAKVDILRPSVYIVTNVSHFKTFKIE